MIRDDDADLVFRDEKAKFNALIDEIAEMQEAGRPVLVGTITVEKSEILATMLKRRGIKHEVLNAKFHEKESGIVAQAGRTGAVTIATNMAGRGTDILLGGNPAGLASEMLHKRGLNPAEVDAETYADGPRRGEGRHRGGPRSAWSRRAGSTSSAPNATTPAGSTTSSAAAPDARATRARRASTCRSKTT